MYAAGYSKHDNKCTVTKKYVYLHSVNKFSTVFENMFENMRHLFMMEGCIKLGVKNPTYCF
jgi:hypothetical protein